MYNVYTCFLVSPSVREGDIGRINEHSVVDLGHSDAAFSIIGKQG